MILSAQHIDLGYRQKKGDIRIHQDISVDLKEGELVCLIGPNGSGKSTLLRTLAGIASPLAGEVMIGNRKLSAVSNQEKGLLIAMVLTDRVVNNFLKVQDLVALGRYPYSGWMGRLNAEDRVKTEEAIELCSLQDLRHKTLDRISDGERQRVMIARAIAQDTPIIILDEPTAHLDMKTRVEILLLLRNLARLTKKSTVVATHELELAISLSDELWLMPEKGRFIKGKPEDLVNTGILSEVFNSEQIRFDEQFKLALSQRLS